VLSPDQRSASDNTNQHNYLRSFPCVYYTDASCACVADCIRDAEQTASPMKIASRSPTRLLNWVVVRIGCYHYPSIQGMDCPSYAHKVTTAFLTIPLVRVNTCTGRASLTYKEGLIEPGKISKRTTELTGYACVVDSAHTEYFALRCPRLSDLLTRSQNFLSAGRFSTHRALPPARFLMFNKMPL